MDAESAAKKHARIDYLAALPGDSEIPKLGESVVKRAHELIDMLNSPTLAVVPTGDGEVMFEWYDQDGHVLGDARPLFTFGWSPPIGPLGLEPFG